MGFLSFLMNTDVVVENAVTVVLVFYAEKCLGQIRCC